jgi:hypothetical protein
MFFLIFSKQLSCTIVYKPTTQLFRFEGYSKNNVMVKIIKQLFYLNLLNIKKLIIKHMKIPYIENQKL